ncbi:MAG: small ribosomal subunit biogenesis GTPase RsgA [Cyanothece sp. SIO2G6]|nr:small ribosomal subunit biogenesis GTPase RsgA [Cyanothece sp. SIO2G6]
MLGTVLSVQANYYWVQLSDGVMQPDAQQAASMVPGSRMLLCTRRSRLKKIGQRVWVGDRVLIEDPDWDGQRGAIAEVLPRKTELDRPPVANANHILLVFAIADPMPDPMQLSRFLVKAESTGLAVTLCLNKTDLVAPEEQNSWRDRLRQWGYEPVMISLLQGEGLDILHHHLCGRSTIVSGPSGVGKSSLINALIPSVEQRVSEVSGKLGRGRHTTRHVELFSLPDAGLIADTPGFNQPDLTCTPSELSFLFPEVRQRLQHNCCQFSNCLHREEPHCVVRGDWERYQHYLTFLADAIAYQEEQEQRSAKESAVKVKSGGEGIDRVEPKLAPKRYRQTSRRRQTQDLQEFRGDVKEMLAQEPQD